MNMPIFYVGGSKGGVGKSKLTFALVDYLLDEGKQVLLLESDTSNPDVYKAHHQHENDMLQCREIDLDTSDGWMDGHGQRGRRIFQSLSGDQFRRKKQYGHRKIRRDAAGNSS